MEDGQILGMANGGNITITKNEDGQVVSTSGIKYWHLYRHPMIRSRDRSG